MLRNQTVFSKKLGPLMELLAVLWFLETKLGVKAARAVRI